MSEVLLPLQERRPADLQAEIDARFVRLQAALPNYTYHGTRNAYQFRPLVSSIEFNQLLLADDPRPLRALDVGTGAGHFVTGSQWSPDDTVHGITAHDYRRNPNFHRPLQPTDDVYKVGDAENFGTIPGLLPKYDMVVSRWTLRHFIDPVGGLEAIADRVDAGGILAVDSIEWLTPNDNGGANFATILEALDDAGYDLDTPLQPNYGRLMVRTFDFPLTPDLVLRRNEVRQPVRIPFEPQLTFYKEKSFASYTPL